MHPKIRAAAFHVEPLESRRLLTAVLSGHYDLAATNTDSTETLLTPSTVNTTSFGKQFATQLDGQSYGQPLYDPGVAISSGLQQGVHNVIYVVTENDTLYAIDANGGNVLWKDSFLDTTNPKVNLLGASSIGTVPNADVGSTDITPQIGITATPVISPSLNAIYIEAKSKQIVASNTAAPNYVQTLYKVDLGSGAIDSSVIIGDTIYSGGVYTYRVSNTTGTGIDPYVNGTGDGAITSQGSVTWGGTSRVYFNALRAMDRPAITIYGTDVYLSFASHGDNGPYHGWLLRYSTSTLTLDGVLNTVPNGGETGIWQGGAPISIDASGSIYFATGNGSFNTAASNFAGNYSGLPLDADYGDSFVKVVNDPSSTQSSPNPNGWGLKITDFFSPSNNATLNNADTDLGSSGPVLLPDAVGSTAHPHLLIGAGKEGKIYLIDRDDMGGFHPGSDDVVQETGANAVGGALSSAAFFLNNPNGSPHPSGEFYYQSDYGGYLQAYTISNANFSALADSADIYTSSLDGSPTVSANGTATPIVWALYRAGNQLRAYDALNLNDELWTTNSNASGGDALSGNVTKFSSPTVADGLVMVADDTYLNVYGPPVPPTTAPAAPGSVTVSSSAYNQVDVGWQDLSSNEDSFYVERSTDQTNWTVVGTTAANVDSYIDKSTLATTTYYYRVRAHNSFQGSSYSAYAYSSAITTTTAPPSGTGDGILANYYVNASSYTPLSGPVVLTRDDPNIYFNWGMNPPAPGISQTEFSVVWTGTVKPATSGSYTFTTTTDDGVRLYFNGALVINDFVDQGPTPANYTVNLTAGQSYTIAMDYYQDGGGASAMLTWTPPGAAAVPVPFVGGYVVGAYHNDQFLQTPAVLTRVEPTVDSNLNWSDGDPSPAVPSTGFSASWSGKIQAQFSEAYTFTTTGDDGIDLWINNTPLISDWLAQGPTTTTGTITLSAGQQVEIEVDYFQGAGGATAILQWSSAHTALEDVPTSQLYSGVAPAAPSGLTATPTSGTQLTLNWQSNSTIQTGFLVQRKVDGTTAWSTLATVAANVTTYSDVNLSPGVTYDYQVQATNFEANSAFSAQAVATLPTIPQTPTNAFASNITTTSLVANWTDRATNATGYRVGVALGDADFDYILVNNPTLTSYSFTNLIPGTEYDVHISAYNIAGYNDFAGFTTTTLTTPPTGLTATRAAGEVALTWQAPVVNAPDFSAITYNVYRGTSPGGEGSTPLATDVATSSYVDSTAGSGTAYYYTVTAVDPGGESAASSETSVSAVTAAPSVQSFTVNDGSAQRSMVTSLTVTFTAPVTLASGAIILTERSTTGGAPTPVRYSTTSSAGGSTYTLNFVGNASLSDGIYDLTVAAGLVKNAAGTANTATQTYTFARLFGDINGDGTVNLADYGAFARSFGASTSSPNYVAAFDYDDNGMINLGDYGQFIRRYGIKYTF